MEGLALEYERRLALVEQLEAQRDGSKRGTPEWITHQGHLIDDLEKLASWLQHMGYGEAAKKLERQLTKERKVADIASRDRLQIALQSIERIDTPPELIEAAAAAATGEEFRVQQSAHIRIVYTTFLNDERVRELLEFGEKCINGFRQEFVDPYYDASFPDWIHAERFQEFYFGPRR